MRRIDRARREIAWFLARGVVAGAVDRAVLLGDCLEVMKGFPDSSVDSVVTDPPYGLAFMGQAWDRYSAEGFQSWVSRWAAECYRVLKPGGHVLAFGGTRMYHRLASGIEDAGFEIRDSLMWLYGSGFPKSLNVGKAVDATLLTGGSNSRSIKKVNALRPGEGREVALSTHWGRGKSSLTNDNPATEAAKQWEGWGTALKPAHEPVVVARKPLEGTVAANVQKWGTGALNIDGCRIDGAPRTTHSDGNRATSVALSGMFDKKPHGPTPPPSGRWPANIVLAHSPDCKPVGSRKIKASVTYYGTVKPGTNKVYGKGLSGPRGLPDHTHGDSEGNETLQVWECVEGCPAQVLDGQSGISKSSGGSGPKSTGALGKRVYGGGFDAEHGHGGLGANAGGVGDTGGASRYFNQFDPPFMYMPKSSTRERSGGLGHRNPHPTVKPINLMAWLVRLVTPAGGVVLDPFTGSGSTGCAAVQGGWRFIGIEMNREYAGVACKRIDFHASKAKTEPAKAKAKAKAKTEPAKAPEGPKVDSGGLFKFNLSRSGRG